DQVQSGEPAQPVDQIDGRYHRALDAEAFLERRHRGPRALPPKPRRSRLGFAGSAARLIYGMFAQNLHRAPHQVAEHIRPSALGQVRFDGLARDVVRGREMRRCDSAAPHHQMPVADAVEKLDSAARQFFAQVGDDLRGFFAGNMARREIVHYHRAAVTRLQRHEVHSKHHVARPHLDSLARRFDRRAPRVIAHRVVAKHRHRADVAARWHPLGDRRDHPERPARRHQVHVRLVRCGERRLAAEFLARPIGHSVAVYEDVLHRINRSASDRDAYSRSRTFITFARSGSTTIVLLKFLSAVSGSFRPWPVSVHTTTEPGLSIPAPAYLSSPATDAADAGSANTPPLAIKRYAARISESVTMSIIPPDSSRAVVAPFQLAGLPILIAVAT